MVNKDQIQNLVALIETARRLGPMTEAQRREQRASWAFGQVALTREWRDKDPSELEKLRQLCRRQAGCTEEGSS